MDNQSVESVTDAHEDDSTDDWNTADDAGDTEGGDEDENGGDDYANDSERSEDAGAAGDGS